MLSHDLQSRAHSLSSSLLSSSSPPQILATISAVHSFLQSHPSDHSRSFFSIAFPSLLARLFGFHSPPSCSAWLHLASDHPALSSALFDLLSPLGPLVSSIYSLDRHSSLHYLFPSERLPEWIRLALQSDKCSPPIIRISPLLQNRVQENNQIRLNLFEYYMFWFAYYPVCKGNSESAAESGGERSKSIMRFRLENLRLSLPSIIGSRGSSSSQQKGVGAQCDLYPRLLYAYLHSFFSRVDSCSQLYKSSLLHYGSPLCRDRLALAQEEFLVHAVVNFWMVDNDFSPLPVGVCRSFGVVFPFRAVLGKSPPTPGLGEVLKLFVKYLNCIGLSCSGEGKYNGESRGKVEFERPRSKMIVCESSTGVGSWNLVIQRPLYRFVLRSFLFCPMGTSIKNAAEVFSLWVSYLTPWKTTLDDFAEFELPLVQNSDNLRRENEGKSSNDLREGCKEKSVYTPVWESYVASNYLFYSSLVVHFLGFAHKFLHTNVDTVVKMVLKVLDILTSSKELMDFIREVDTAYHSKQSGPSSSFGHSVNKYVPSICEQLQDWEDGLCVGDADGSFLHDNWNHDLKLFNDVEDGASKLLQLFILRAEHEIQASSGGLQNVDSIRSQMSILFGGAREFCMPSPVKLPHEHGEFNGLYNFGTSMFNDNKCYDDSWMYSEGHWNDLGADRPSKEASSSGLVHLEPFLPYQYSSISPTVPISGNFLHFVNPFDSSKGKVSRMILENQELVVPNSQQCCAPSHAPGVLKDELCLLVRLMKLLAPRASTESTRACELKVNLFLMLCEDQNDWIKIGNDNIYMLEYYRSPPQYPLILKKLKERLYVWLVNRIDEDGRGLNVLDEEGQGVIHSAAALGYEWAIRVVVTVGINLNSKDAWGRTGLHWAAQYGRQEAVLELLNLQAAPGAVLSGSRRTFGFVESILEDLNSMERKFAEHYNVLE